MQAGTAAELSTQAQKNLQQRGVKFDLKAGKTYTVDRMLRGVGKIKYTIKVSDVKVSDSNEEGFKQATFKWTTELKKPLTKKQQKSAHKALKKQGYYWDAMESDLYCFVLDYATGQNLEDSENAPGVKATFTSKKDVKTEKYYDTDGSWFCLSKKSVRAAKIVFPEDYEGLCIGIGPGVTYRSAQTNADLEFSNVTGTTYRYHQTSWFKKGNDNFHYLRVS